MKKFSAKHFIFLLVFGLFLASCTYLIKKLDRADNELLEGNTQKLSIVFSHNINGETHPCGCRKFPLGGLPQVAGKMAEIKEKNPLLYVDTGDTFFPSSTVPDHVNKSLTFAADNLSQGLEMLGLKFHVPGDQDLAKGMPFYRKLINERKYQVLAANIKNPKRYNGRDFVHYSKGDHHIFLSGVVAPSILPGNTAKFFSSPLKAMERTLENLKKEGFDPTNDKHRFIVLSSGGIDFDRDLAGRFPDIDWIIGGHSQSFLQNPKVINGVKLVQVLSRNHYLGEVQLQMSNSPNDSYQVHEIHESLSEKLDPNPFVSFIRNHKEKMDKLQQEEQSQMSTGTQQVEKLPTSQSCLDCHKPQARKWMSTAHSLAYTTLLRAQESNNLTCVKCHSVGLGDKRGFSRVQDMVVFEKQVENPKDLETKKLQKLRANYWKDVKNELSDIESVRALSPEQTRKHAESWMKIDKEHNVAHNFSNVQCLNCHEQSIDHPFEMDKKDLNPEEKFQAMKKNCLSCHNPDQSPSWYKEDERGLQTEPNESVIVDKMKEVGCPKMKN